jgi:hypothetical protein
MRRNASSVRPDGRTAEGGAVDAQEVDGDQGQPYAATRNEGSARSNSAPAAPLDEARRGVRVARLTQAVYGGVGDSEDEDPAVKRRAA